MGRYYYKLKSYGIVRYYKKKSSGYREIVNPIDGEKYFGETIEILQNSENLNQGFKRNNQLSKRSKSKITQRVTWLAEFANWKYYKTKKGKVMRFKLNMITLTYVGDIDEKTAKRNLNDFLNVFRNSYNLKNYLWKIELTKRGRIHYHIVTDTDYTLELTTKIWNRILRRNKMLGRSEVNSTDVKRFSNAFSYLSKYVGKDDEKTFKVLKGRIWGCSQSLSLKDIEKSVQELAEITAHFVHSRRIKYKFIQDDYFEIWLFDLRELRRIPDLWTELQKGLNRVIDFYPSTHTEYSEEIEELFKRTEEVTEECRTHGYGLDY